MIVDGPALDDGAAARGTRRETGATGSVYPFAVLQDTTP